MRVISLAEAQVSMTWDRAEVFRFLTGVMLHGVFVPIMKKLSFMGDHTKGISLRIPRILARSNSDGTR